MRGYTYSAYGLRIVSSFPIPELRQTQPGPADVHISCSTVPETLSESSSHGTAWQSDGKQLLLRVHEVARYLIAGDSEIRVQPVDGASNQVVRMFLLGSALAALLHARRILVLHASVIQTPRGAVLFMGRSGSGKSTLLGAFLQRGYRMLTDDKAGIIVGPDGRAMVLPGMPFLRLTKDAVAKLSFPVTGSMLSSGLDKYIVPAPSYCEGMIPVRTAYSILPHNRPDIFVEPVDSIGRFELLSAQIYRSRFVRNSDQRQAIFQTLGAVATGAGVAKVRWPDYPCRLTELVSRIEKDLN